MSQTITEIITLQTITCYKCAVIFAISSEQKGRLKTSGGNFWCPNGHEQHYTETENMRLKKELEQKQRELTASKCETMAEKFKREAVEAESAATIKRIERKTKHGVCPCCGRTFHSLRDHMKKQHPEYGPKQKMKLP